MTKKEKRTPSPMGWNSYDYYDTTVDEKAVKANADYMATFLKEAGYQYIVVDIQWYSYQAGEQRERYQYVPFCKADMDEFGRYLPCLTRFPSAADGKGFAPLAEYVHEKGLKFGIHIMRGIPREAAHKRMKILGSSVTADKIADPGSICFWNPDMYGLIPTAEGAQEYYNSLMSMYAGWGVDFVKCDDICRMDARSAKKEIEMYHKAIENSGRDMIFSLSPGPAFVEEDEFYSQNADMWRITDDLWDNWKSLRDMFERCEKWQVHGTNYGFPDCDMLPLGRIAKGFGEERETRLTPAEQRTMFSLWCIVKSPLMLGAELTKLSAETLSLITNKELLKLHQVLEPAKELYRDEKLIIWQGKDFAAIFNVSDKLQSVCANVYVKELSNGRSLRNLWTGETFFSESTQDILSHGCLVFQF